MTKAGVTVRLNTEATPALIAQLKPDVLIWLRAASILQWLYPVLT